MSLTPDGPAGPFSDRDYDSDYRRPPTNATNGPGIALIILGILNLLLGLYLLVNAFAISRITPEQLQAQMDETYRRMNMQPAPVDWVAVKPVMDVGYFIWAGVGILAAVLTLIGGVKMRSLRSYGMAMTGAILSMIPFVSCLGCCGVGEAIGLWALIVLLKDDVKAAFR